MLTTPDLVAGTGFTIDSDRRMIRFERSFSATAVEMFEAWTDPSQIRLWWDPTGRPLKTCEIDLREGGVFSFVTQDHPDRPFTGVYCRIDRPSLLEFDAMGAKGRVSFQDAEGTTSMVVEIISPSAEHFNQFVTMGVADNTSRTLDNLVAFKTRN